MPFNPVPTVPPAAPPVEQARALRVADDRRGRTQLGIGPAALSAAAVAARGQPFAAAERRHETPVPRTLRPSSAALPAPQVLTSPTVDVPARMRDEAPHLDEVSGELEPYGELAPPVESSEPLLSTESSGGAEAPELDPWGGGGAAERSNEVMEGAEDQIAQDAALEEAGALADAWHDDESDGPRDSDQLADDIAEEHGPARALIRSALAVHRSELAPDSTGTHSDFFARGEDGSYPGGPSERPTGARHPSEESDEIELEPIAGLTRSPEQERRRVLMAKLVAGILGVAVAIVLGSFVLSLMRGRGRTERALAPDPSTSVVSLASAAPPEPTPGNSQDARTGDGASGTELVDQNESTPGANDKRSASGRPGEERPGARGAEHSSVARSAAEPGSRQGGSPSPPSASPVATGLPSTAAFPVP